AQRRQKILPQQRHELALGRLVRHLLSIPTPQLQIRKKLGPLVVELGVRLISRFALLHRTVTRILYGQSRGDDEHFAQTLLITGRQYHAAHTRINRQPGLLAPHGGKAIVLVERTELLQLLVAVGNGPTRRCVDEWKGLDVIELERLHAQNHGRQRRAQHLGIGKGGARLEIGLVVKPYADARTHAPATSGTLIGGCLADGLDAQLLNLVAPRIAFYARQAAIDDVTDTRNGERRFGHVRGQHDAPRVALGPEDALLFRLREPRVQRKHLRSRRVVLAQGLDRFADLTLARKENQHIARTVAGTFVDALDHRIDQVTLLVAAAAAPAAFFCFVAQYGSVTHLNRIQSPGHLDHGCGAILGAEVSRKPVGVDGGGSDDQLEVAPLDEQLLEEAQQKINVQAALVRLVDDDRVVTPQQRVALRLCQQNAIGHQLDRHVGPAAVAEADLVADPVAQFGVQFFGNAFGHRSGRQSARLRMRDHAALPATEFQA